MPMILAWNVRYLHKGTKVHQVSDEKLNQMKHFNSRFLAVGLGLAILGGLTNAPAADQDNSKGKPRKSTAKPPTPGGRPGGYGTQPGGYGTHPSRPRTRPGGAGTSPAPPRTP